MKRKMALEVIRIEFAKYGVATKTSTRAYIEGRISLSAFNEAKELGLKQFNLIESK